MAKSTGYTGNFYIGQGHYYIHKNITHVGMAKNVGPSFDYRSLFEQRKSAVWNAVSNQYRKLFIANLKDVGSSSILVAQLEDVNNDKFMQDISDQLKDDLLSTISSANITLNAGQLWHDYFNSNDGNYKDLLSNGTKRLRAFDNLLSLLIKSSQYLMTGDNKNKLLEILLITQGMQGYLPGRVSYLNARITELVNKLKFENEGAILSIQENQLYQVAKQINYFSNAYDNFVKRGAGNNNDINQRALRTYLTHIFSNGFGETVLSTAHTKMLNIAKQNIIQSVGETNVPKVYFDENGNEYTTSFEEDKKVEEKDGKVDISFDNFKLNISRKFGKNYADINIKLGISEKNYTNFNFGEASLNSDKNRLKVNSGEGVTVKEAINAIFGVNLENRDKYISYNTIVHNMIGIENLYNLIKIRMMLSLFSTRGGAKDFAQVLIINGNIFTVWDILQLLKNGKSDFMSVSIKGISAIRGANKKRAKDNLARAHSVNNVLLYSTLSSNLHINKLANALKEVENK